MSARTFEGLTLDEAREAYRTLWRLRQIADPAIGAELPYARRVLGFDDWRPGARGISGPLLKTLSSYRQYGVGVARAVAREIASENGCEVVVRRARNPGTIGLWTALRFILIRDSEYQFAAERFLNDGQVATPEWRNDLKRRTSAGCAALIEVLNEYP